MTNLMNTNDVEVQILDENKFEWYSSFENKQFRIIFDPWRMQFTAEMLHKTDNELVEQ